MVLFFTFAQNVHVLFAKLAIRTDITRQNTEMESNYHALNVKGLLAAVTI
jgi:hypothetical protein